MVSLNTTVLGILGLAAVPAITRMVAQDELMTWLNNLALLGFALIVADNFRQIRLDHQIAHAYMESADPSVKAAIEISWPALVELNPQALLSFVLLLIWIGAVSLRLARQGVNRRLMQSIGLLLAGATVVMTLGISLDNRAMRVAAVLLGILALPAWFTILGWRILKRESIH